MKGMGESFLLSSLVANEPIIQQHNLRAPETGIVLRQAPLSLSSSRSCQEGKVGKRYTYTYHHQRTTIRVSVGARWMRGCDRYSRNCFAFLRGVPFFFVAFSSSARCHPGALQRAAAEREQKYTETCRAPN